MRTPVRIALPVAAALLLAGGIIAMLFVQLEGTRAMLVAQLLREPEAGSGAVVRDPSVPTLLSIREDGALLHLRRGDVFALRGEWKEAAEAYREAVRSDGGLPALRKLIDAQLQRRDIRGARDTLDRLRRAGAGSEDLLLWEVSIALRTGELTGARSLLEGADPSPHRQWGLALLALIGDRHEEARAALRETAGGWEPLLRARARQLLAAYEEYARFPGSPDIHLQTLLSRALAGAGECELALPVLSRVTRAQEDYRDAWIVRGFCELMTERTEEALASLEQAYRIDPQKAETQYFLARAYRARGDHANALTFLQYALRNGFQPEAEARLLLAEEAQAAGMGSLALEQSVLLTRLPGATVETFERAVQAALAAGEAVQARALAEEAAGRWPDDPRAQALSAATSAPSAPQE